MVSHKHISVLALGVFVVASIYFYAPYKESTQNVQADDTFKDGAKIKLPDSGIPVTHIKTPESVKSLYMTAWVAGTQSMRDHVIDLLNTTETNAVVIDIKDATGRVAFTIENEPFKSLGSPDNRIPDIRDLIGRLHEKGIYVIGRVATFQDPYLIKKWPEEAVKTKTDKTVLWCDRKGIGWFDAGSHKVWDYVIALARESYAVGFDEINFDYVRFPSDGNMNDIYFPHSDGKVKSDVLESFFKYADEQLHTPDNPLVISADLFGMVTTNTDDLGIGQVLEKALPHFDFIDPMVYPSHFPDTWNGYGNPAEHPYEVIKKTMDTAVARAVAMGEDPKKLRPWLQDFNLGATYTAEMVRAQIKATYDAGLSSWLIWDPRNVYTKAALVPEG
jgi:hypothetical protein